MGFDEYSSYQERHSSVNCALVYYWESGQKNKILKHFTWPTVLYNGVRGKQGKAEERNEQEHRVFCRAGEREKCRIESSNN
jgi:hypothetical protein